MNNKAFELFFGNNIEDLKEEIEKEHKNLNTIKKLSGGYSNYVFEFQDSKGVFLLKCLISKEHRSLGNYSSIENEVATLKLLSSFSSIRTPKLFSYNTTDSFRHFFIMEKIEGVCPSIGENAQSNTTWDSIGRLLAELHKIKPQNEYASGYVCNQTGDNWFDFLKKTTDNLNHKPKWVKKYLKIINKYEVLLKNVQTSFVHGDIWENNILITKNQDLVIIDFEYGMFGDPLMDFLLFMPTKQLNKKTLLLDAYNNYAKTKIEGSIDDNIRFFICNGFYAIETLLYMEKARNLPFKNYVRLRLLIWYYKRKCMKGIKLMRK